MEKSSNIAALVKEWSYRYTITRFPPFLGGWIFFEEENLPMERNGLFPDVDGLFLWPLDRAKSLPSRGCCCL